MRRSSRAFLKSPRRRTCPSRPPDWTVNTTAGAAVREPRSFRGALIFLEFAVADHFIKLHDVYSSSPVKILCGNHLGSYLVPLSFFVKVTVNCKDNIGVGSCPSSSLIRASSAKIIPS